MEPCPWKEINTTQAKSKSQLALQKCERENYKKHAPLGSRGELWLVIVLLGY
jgi:hypothetical protein